MCQILIIDDDEHLRLVLRKLLSRQGARLHGAVDRKLKTVEGFVQLMKPK